MHRVTPSDLLLAADVGGTSARVAVGARDEMPEPVLGPGANIRSSGPGALAALVPTIRTALAGRDPARISRAVIALAGAGPARRAQITRELEAHLAGIGLPPQRLVVADDLTAAFVSAAPGPDPVRADGLLLLAGTGAVAARFEAGALAARVDGMGWLLGDVGSAVWLGRHVLEAVAADIDGRGERTALTGLVGAALGLDLRDGAASPTGDPRQDLIAAVDELSPAQLGRFAPLPARAVADPAGDPVAAGILDAAVAGLVRSAGRLDPRGELPVVLAGSVLGAEGPVRAGVVAALTAAGHPAIATARSGLAGAWRLAEDA